MVTEKNQWERTERLIGKNALDALHSSRVAIFGIGGVGGYVAEALVRSGVGAFDLIDKDVVDLTNLNRQIIATQHTIGQAKVQVMKERILSINPNAEVVTYERFYLPETAQEFPLTAYDYIVDAIDTVTAKLELIQRAKQAGIPIISCMGAGNKLDPTRFEVTDIYQTSVCPLAKIMRHELRMRGVEQLKVVYSRELPVVKTRTPGSIAFVPSVAGLVIAGEVIKDLCKDTECS